MTEDRRKHLERRLETARFALAALLNDIAQLESGSLKLYDGPGIIGKNNITNTSIADQKRRAKQMEEAIAFYQRDLAAMG